MTLIHIVRIQVVAPNPTPTGKDLLLYNVTDMVKLAWERVTALGQAQQVLLATCDTMQYDMLQAGAKLHELRWEALRYTVDPEEQ